MVPTAPAQVQPPAVAVNRGQGDSTTKVFFPSEEIPFPQAITLVNISNVQPTDGKLHILQGNRNESLLLLYSH